MRFLILIAMLVATQLYAAPSGTDYGSTSSKDARLTAALGMIESGQAPAAITMLEEVVARNSDNADAWNLLGYAHRKEGDFAASRAHYTRALTLNPRHEGALSYMGILELEEGNIDAARALYARLQAVCFLGCEPLDDLTEAFIARGTPVS
jgi:Flp pilus assembly protein TadD